MSFRVRPARARRFRRDLRMAKLTGGGFTNLPADKGTLVAKLARSEAAFSRDADDADRRPVRLRARECARPAQIRGTCQVFSQVGQEQPFYSYRISTLTQTSPELERTFRAEMLTLCTDFEGC